MVVSSFTPLGPNMVVSSFPTEVPTWLCRHSLPGSDFPSEPLTLLTGFAQISLSTLHRTRLESIVLSRLVVGDKGVNFK